MLWAVKRLMLQQDWFLATTRGWLVCSSTGVWHDFALLGRLAFGVGVWSLEHDNTATMGIRTAPVALETSEQQ